MSQFSRRAKWLNFIFPASVLPQSQDPGSVSDDISLVQPYDGGGWSIPLASSWLIQKLTAVGATSTTDMLTVPEGSVYRLFAVNAFEFAGPGFSATFQTFIANIDAIPITAVALHEKESTLGSNRTGDLKHSIVVPGGLTIRVDVFAGNAATQLKLGIYGCLAPAGTVFYC